MLLCPSSTLRLSFEVRAGLVFRQIHHWAALVMMAAVSAHAIRVFLTGAFRKPRDLNWMFGVTLLLSLFQKTTDHGQCDPAQQSSANAEDPEQAEQCHPQVVDP